ncbi:MAG: hypothetical protein A2107_10270 [Verrucomicrobia bacterium GWF2_62_7]|nr:MAG: hypothetical protein A2107_10270 [Verrucomicrobia bacterium GWF2_62_7]
MPTFNPNEPATDSDLKSAPVRDNFNALKAEIDAAPTTQQVTDAINAAVADKPTNDEMNGAISDAINGTPRNVDGIGTLDIGISDPPTQGEVQLILEKLNDLIRGLKRNI